NLRPDLPPTSSQASLSACSPTHFPFCVSQWESMSPTLRLESTESLWQPLVCFPPQESPLLWMPTDRSLTTPAVSLRWPAWTRVSATSQTSWTLWEIPPQPWEKDSPLALPL